MGRRNALAHRKGNQRVGCVMGVSLPNVFGVRTVRLCINYTKKYNKKEALLN